MIKNRINRDLLLQRSPLSSYQSSNMEDMPRWYGYQVRRGSNYNACHQIMIIASTLIDIISCISGIVKKYSSLEQHVAQLL